MIHGNKLRKFNRKRKVRSALMASLALSLVERGRITTTEAKAKSLRPVVEKIITKGKLGTLGAKREIIAIIGQTGAKKAEALSKKFADRKGGYTRIIKANRRLSDGSAMAVIEFV